MKLAPLLVLSFAAASLLPGQEKKTTEPKAPTHSPEQSALNTIKEDARLKEKLKKAAASVKKGAQANEAAQKEVDRLEKSKLVPGSEEVRAKLEKLKKSLDPKDIQEYKKLLEEELKKARAAARERNKTGEAGPPAPGAAPEPDPVPGSFDNSSKQEPLPVRKSPVFQTPVLTAREIATGMVKDPVNPKVDLPESDLRTRTFVLEGDVRLRRPDIVVDADYTSLVFKPGQTPGGKKTGKADHISGDSRSRPIESLVARGRVRFMLVNKDGSVQAGRCGTLLYDDRSGLFIMKDWPEAEGVGNLIRGKKKESVIRLSRTQQATSTECDVLTLEKELTIGDVPRDAEHEIPPARPIKPGSTPSSSSSIR